MKGGRQVRAGVLDLEGRWFGHNAGWSRVRRVIGALVFLLLTCGPVKAADLNVLNESDRHTFNAKDGSKLLYALAEPEKAKPGKRYPLVVFLHGAGGMRPAGERNAQRSWDGAGQFYETMTEDCYFFMPQANSVWSGIAWEVLPYRMSSEPEKCQNQSVMECIEALLEDRKYAIDPDRVYLAGASMGSMGMWDLACRRPDLFAAGISCCGGFDAEQAPKIARIKFRMFHGDADNIVPPAGSKAMYEALKDAGADVEYHVYPGANHFIWEQTYRNKENLDWLFAQRRAATKSTQEAAGAKSGDVPFDANREFRTWVSKSGAKLEAKLLETRGGKVVLSARDGSRKHISSAWLSPDDLDYIESLLK
jgi:predicted esterase